MKTYIWAVDAGHEWLAVKQEELINLNIADQISAYSFMKGGTVYLEGDCDAAVFIDAYTAKFGHAPKTKAGKTWDRQPCRSFARYVAPKPVLHIPEGENLNNYIEQRNRWMSIFSKQELVRPLNQAGVDCIVDQLNGDLSPENLHCDGEISPAQARAKYNFYKQVAAELEAYANSANLDLKEIYEL